MKPTPNPRRRASFTIATIALAIITCAALGHRGSKWEDGVRQRMADYLFMEAKRYNAIDQPTNYYEAMMQSYKLDSTESAKKFEVGYMHYIAGSANDDVDEMLYGDSLMLSHCKAHPEDYDFNRMYAEIVNSSDALEVWRTLDSLNPHNLDVTYQYAEALFHADDTASVQKSIDVYNRIEAAEGKDVGVVARKIRSYYFLGDTLAIDRELKALFDSSPKSADYHVYASDLYMAMSKSDSALNHINIACALDSTNGEAINKRAYIYLARGDSLTFNREAYRAIRNPNLDLETKLQTVKGYAQELYQDSTQHERIYNLVEGLMEQYPSEPQVIELYGTYLLSVGKTDEGLDKYQEALELEPNNEKEWNSLVVTAMQLSGEAKTIKIGERALELFPNSAPLNYFVGVAYAGNNDIAKAMSHYNRALKNVDGANQGFVSQVLASIGDAYYSEHQLDSAYANYDRALQLNYDNALALNNYAYFLAENDGDLAKAEKMGSRAVDLVPYSATYLDTYAWVLFKQGRYAEAREQIDKALEIEDELQPDEYHHAGDIYFKLGDTEAAIEFWKKALELEPDNELLKRKVENGTYYEK